MLSVSTFVAYLYQMTGMLLTLYACFMLTSVLLFLFYRRQRLPPSDQLPGEWPQVTVQIPIYNEPRVAARVVQAVAAFDYPTERLQIQVLDDSTDAASTTLAALITHLRLTQHLDITYHHRRQRHGYKAGALAAALPHATGDYLAVFDADFVPPSDWLRRTTSLLVTKPEVGFLQTRWGHLNWSQNMITAAQGLALDGHFVIEQQARSSAGFLQNFNGSAGLWRRAAIEAAGGWSSDTVTEDLDLSYRAQLAGWRGAYLDAVEAPAELPPLLSSFKRQQRRWAKGSAQTLRKLAAPLLRSPLPWSRRLYALIHLGGYAMHLPLLTLLILTLPMALLPSARLPFPALGMLSMLVSLTPLLLYGLAQQQRWGWGGLQRLWALPVLTLISLGLSPTIGGATLEGLRRQGGAFDRTPKQGQGPQWLALPDDAHWRELLPEALILTYALVTLTITVAVGRWQLAPLPILYTLGCLLTLTLGLQEYSHAARTNPGLLRLPRMP